MVYLFHHTLENWVGPRVYFVFGIIQDFVPGVPAGLNKKNLVNGIHYLYSAFTIERHYRVQKR